MVDLLRRFSDGERRQLLAERGRYPIGATADEVELRCRALAPHALLAAAQATPWVLQRCWRSATDGARFPGRSEALRTVAHALALRVPADEYHLPEDALEVLLGRVRAAAGRRVPVRGKLRHKGRVGDGIERLLVGGKVHGKTADHAAAEIKSVPVRGDRVIERVKLGVISARSNPLRKCGRVLFVFVEQRGGDHFVRGHQLEEFDEARWQAMWRDGFLVETSAGSPRFPARGLYLTPKWFRNQHLWPG